MTTPPLQITLLDLLRQGHDDEAAWEEELPETERDAIGTPHLWSAKDHVIHRNFGRQNLLHVLRAILHHQDVPPRDKINDEVNAEVFAEQRLHPWSELQAESERLYADLIHVFDHLSEEDLRDEHRFTSTFFPGDEGPLYAAFLAYWYEHGQEHLVQYYRDRNNLQRAMTLRERCATRVVQTDMPDWVKGWFLYNLVIFYTQQNQRENAIARLQEAATYNPRLQEFAKSDPQLAALPTISA